MPAGAAEGSLRVSGPFVLAPGNLLTDEGELPHGKRFLHFGRNDGRDGRLPAGKDEKFSAEKRSFGFACWQEGVGR